MSKQVIARDVGESVVNDDDLPGKPSSREQASTSTEAIPLNRGSWRRRVWLGAGLSAACVLMAVVPLVRGSTGDAEGFAALAALAALPLPLSILLSGIAMNRRWKPDLLFRGLPVLVAMLMLGALAWLGTQ